MKLLLVVQIVIRDVYDL